MRTSAAFPSLVAVAPLMAVALADPVVVALRTAAVMATVVVSLLLRSERIKNFLSTEVP
jgi:hypothetical protein